MKFNNIVMVVVDTLRAKNLPSYNSDKETTSFLSSRKSIDNYYSNAPWTVPAHATLLTGELPSEHGVNTENTYFNCNNKLASGLNDCGYRTIALSENSLFSPSLGFSKGFDFFGNPIDVYPEAESWNKIWEKDGNYSGRKEKYSDFAKLLAKNRDMASVNAALNYFRRDPREEDYNPTKSKISVERATEFLSSDEKTFLFLNLMPVHASYTFEQEQKEEFLPDISAEDIEEATNFDTLSEYLEQDIEMENIFEIREKAYNASINYVDTLLQDLYEKSPSDTLFVVVGDHGELIGEYEKFGSRLVDHHFGTFKELVQVPLFIYSKGRGIDLEVEGELFDHVSLHNFLISAAEGDFYLEGKDTVRSEYFGKSGFNRQRGDETPQKYKELFDRKSFSLIGEDQKVDFASDGVYCWSRDGMTEDIQLFDEEMNSELKEKGEIMYGWRVEEE